MLSESLSSPLNPAFNKRAMDKRRETRFVGVTGLDFKNKAAANHFAFQGSEVFDMNEEYLFECWLPIASRVRLSTQVDQIDSKTSISRKPFTSRSSIFLACLMEKDRKGFGIQKEYSKTHS